MAILLFFAAVSLVAAPSAIATYHLTNSNVAELQGFDVTVVVYADDTINVFTSVQGGYPTPLGIDQFYYNNATTIPLTGVSGNNVGWTFNKATTTADGFGNFASKKNQGPAETSLNLLFSTSTDLTNPGQFVVNSRGGTFAVHVRFGNDCSGWFSDGTSNDVSSNLNCGGPPTVPEFGVGSVIMTSIAVLALFSMKAILPRRKILP